MSNLPLIVIFRLVGLTRKVIVLRSRNNNETILLVISGVQEWVEISLLSSE